jgi:hypothetical protein
VSRRTDPLPCGLVNAPCDRRGGVVACIDRLLGDGTCAAVPHAEFAGFTALPPPNDYSALCTDPPAPGGPCTGRQPTGRLTVDGAGNLLIAVDWRGILLNDNDVPIARLLEASASVEPFVGLGGVLGVPGFAFLQSFSPEGRHLPPLFEQRGTGANDRFRLFGSADAGYTVLRVARRAVNGRCDTAGRACTANSDCPAGDRCRRFLACSGVEETPCNGDPRESVECVGQATCGPTRCTACAGGSRAGAPCRTHADCPDGSGGPGALCAPTAATCATDEECPNAECGPALFDFDTRLLAGSGPVLVDGVQAAARDPVQL